MRVFPFSKKESKMKKEDAPVLSQLSKSLEKAGKKLEESYTKQDYDEFNKSKKFILELQKKIAEIIK